jgi:hypothetical protein
MFAFALRLVCLSCNGVLGALLLGNDNTCMAHTIFMGSASILLALAYYWLYHGASAFFGFVMGSSVMGRIRRHRHAPVPQSDYVVDDTLWTLSDSESETANGNTAVAYSANVIWRNVYGLGGSMYVLVIVIQFSNDVAVLCTTVGFLLNAVREHGGQSKVTLPFFLSCLVFLCIYVASMLYSLMVDPILPVLPDFRPYSVFNMLISVGLPLGVPYLLKSVHKPNNITETIKLSMPTTCIVALVMVFVSMTNMHPCVTNELLQWVWVADDQDLSGKMAIRADILLMCVALPIVTLSSIMMIVGATLQKRSIDIVCGLALIHSVHFWVVHLKPTQPENWAAEAMIACSVLANLILAGIYVQEYISPAIALAKNWPPSDEMDV